MGRHAAVIRPAIEPGRRVVAVSDIHGNLPFLTGLLERVALTPDDVLIWWAICWKRGGTAWPPCAM